LWWGPRSDFPPDVFAAATDFFRNINGSAYFGIAQQYMRDQGQLTTQFVGSLFDASAPPPSPPELDVIAGEVCKILPSAGLRPGEADIYFVFTSNYPSPDPNYLGWHGQGSCDGKRIKVVYIPAAAHVNPAPFTCSTYSVNSQFVVNAVAHELMETITDPVPLTGWCDADGQEIADKCVSHLGDCMPIGDTRWRLQQIWSNAIQRCAP
jgi:hypothetical protein